MKFRRDTPVTTLIIAINIFVFIMWKGWLPATWGISPSFMESNFLVSYSSLLAARYKVDGSLDSSFASNGKLDYRVNVYTDAASSTKPDEATAALFSHGARRSPEGP